MSASSPHDPGLESLRKRAKQLLKARHAGDPDALARFARSHPHPPDAPVLRDAQLVLAREHGLRSWTELRADVERRALARLDLAQRADAFVDLACLAYSPLDSPRRRERAERMLADDPELAGASIHAAAVAGDVPRLRRLLDADPALARARGGPRGWDALLYLCYARVRGPDPACDPVAAARLLLERRADPNTYTLLNDRYRFTALTGVMGEGEGGVVRQPPHAQHVDLSRVLLDAGADPNDAQGLYDTMFQPSTAWLELLLARGLTAEALVNWDTGSGRPARTLDFLLASAARRGQRERVTLLLAHGADPNTVDTYNQRSCHHNAQIAGHTDIAEQLERYGAVADELTPVERFRVAVLRGDAQQSRQMAAQDARLLDDPQLMLDAADGGHLAAVRLLLELGMRIDASHESGVTPLHQAAWRGHEELVRELVERGAPVEARERTYGSTPVGWADHGAGSWTANAGQPRVRDYLLERSTDVLDLATHGRAERLSRVLEQSPARIDARDASGNTALHTLRDETPELEAVIDVLLRHGARLDLRNDAGLTPIESAERSEHDRVADALHER